MTKIDIITLTGFTGIDGSYVASGATVKFSSEFNIGSTAIMTRPEVFRNRELFEEGYSSIKTIEIPNEIRLVLTPEEFYVVTPQILYTKITEYLNNYFGNNVFEIQITE